MLKPVHRYASLLLSGALTIFCGGGMRADRAEALDVYVMSSGNVTADQAIQTALVAGGHTPTVGVQLCAWDGTQTNLTNFDAVVLLNSYNWSSCGTMPANGVNALLGYVDGGGGVITGEWLAWNIGANSNGKHAGLAPIMPATGGPFNSAASTTYSQVVANADLNNGLPSSFTFPLNNVNGTESDLTAKKGAVVFYSSSNGGGAGGGNGGVVGRCYGAGRTVSFSTFLSQTELANADYTQLLNNAVDWAAQDCGALTLKRGVLGLDSDPHEDQVSLIGSFISPADSIDPPNEGVTIILGDADGQIIVLSFPAGDGWTTNAAGTTWSFKDAKDHSLSDPTAIEKLKIKYNVTKGAFSLTVSVKKTELIDPDASDIRILLTIGGDMFTNQQEWKPTANGKKLVTP